MQPQASAAAAVTHRVGDQLMHGQHEIVEIITGQPGARGMLPDLPPQGGHLLRSESGASRPAGCAAGSLVMGGTIPLARRFIGCP